MDSIKIHILKKTAFDGQHDLDMKVNLKYDIHLEISVLYLTFDISIFDHRDILLSMTLIEQVLFKQKHVLNEERLVELAVKESQKDMMDIVRFYLKQCDILLEEEVL